MPHRLGSLIAPPSLSIAVAVVILLHSVSAAGSPTFAPDASDRQGGLPATVSVARELEQYVEAMLAASTTFRAQCQRIADARSIVVLIRVDPALVERTYRARTWFGRTRVGELVARVHISLRTNPVEWIAHELEHVVEQLDGWSLPALAAGRQGAWLSADNMFETDRAIDAGRRVAAEIRQAARRRSHPDIFVE